MKTSTTQRSPLGSGTCSASSDNDDDASDRDPYDDYTEHDAGWESGLEDCDFWEECDHKSRPKHSAMLDVSKTQTRNKWGRYLCAEVTVARTRTQKGLPDGIAGEFVLKARKHHHDGSQSKWIVIAWGSFGEAMRRLRRYEAESPAEIVADMQKMFDAGMTIY